MSKSGLIVTTVIAFLGSFGAFGVFMTWLLGPIKKDIENLKEGLAKLEAKIDQLIAKS